jgi:hypothetical protein
MLTIKNVLAKRKVQKYLNDLKKSKDQQEESMIKLRDEEAQKSQVLDQNQEPPQGLMDRRALSPFWRLKFKKRGTTAQQDQILQRPDLRIA